MFNTHLILIPMSFSSAGIACGLLGITPHGIFFTAMLFSLCWIHITLYLACQIFLDLELDRLPINESWIALVCFIAGYAMSYGYNNFQTFCIALLAWGIFFLHDFVFGVILLFGGSTLRDMLVRMPPIKQPPHKRRVRIKYLADDPKEDNFYL